VAQKRLEDAHNHNTDMMTAGFSAADRRQFVLMRVLNDIVTNRELYADDKGILWGNYAAEYEGALALITLAETHGGSVTQVTEETIPTFGGDL